MKKILSLFIAFGIIALALPALVLAQNNRKTSTVTQNYVISAKAGGVNYIEGDVSVTRKIGKSGLLIKGDKLEIGDKVSTGAGGRAEILLNPGSYVRLDGNTSFEFEDTSLNDLRLKLHGGSAILEVFAGDEFKVTVVTPKTQFYAVDSGVYRVDAAVDGTAKIEVWRGKAQVGDTNATKLKGGREAVVGNDQVTVAKFDRDERDELETWSKDRAKELAKLNARLERRVLRDSLLSSFNGRGWNLYDSFGLWIYDASISNYCFLPFGYGWSSPYGFYYGRSIWNYRLPQTIYNQPPPPTSVNNNGNNNGRNNNGNTNGNNPLANRPPSVPPFERINNGDGASPIQMRRYDPRREDIEPMNIPSPPSSVPMSTPGVSSPPPSSMPVNQPGVPTKGIPDN
jgi:hypothetical protein